VTSWSRQRFAAVVREERVDLGLACLLLAVEAEPTLPVDDFYRELDQLAGTVEARGPRDEALQRALRQFGGAPSDYADLRSSLLPDVLRRRRGLPILLSVVWLEVARRCRIPAYGVGLPGHFVVAVGEPGRNSMLFDPFSRGQRLTLEQAARLVGRPLSQQDLGPWQPVDILQRILANVRNWAAGDPARLPTRLWAVELALLLPRHPLDLRLERGTLLAQLGDYLGAAETLEAYADVLADVAPDRADQARQQARAVRARLN
jgi:regulator of sirC expression with transglutaminase-like and TPR domain